MQTLPDSLALYRYLYCIRRFEEILLENFARGVFFGTTHTCLGQEANAVGVLSHLQPGDVVFSNHRCHGHFLAYGGDARALFAELMGKATGVCAGRGGSQHLHWQNFYSNGIQGGIVPLAVGMGLAEKLKRTGAVAVAFLGDGTFGEGVVYEAFNLASLWKAPVLFVVENNRIAQTTPLELALAGDIATRFQAFGIPQVELNSSDVVEISAVAADCFTRLRLSQSPQALILHTHRFGPHSKGDDTRDEAVLAQIKASRDPLLIQSARLTAGQREKIESEVDAELEHAYQQALLDPYPTLVSESSRVQAGIRQPSPQMDPAQPVSLPMAREGIGAAERSLTILEALNAALHRAMAANERVYLLGEDLLDPYGGAFKVTRGLSTAFPGHVLTTPISEAGITGAAGGMALRGLRPVVEIMFGDFLTLVADQLINHLTKFRWMYNDQVSLPIVIRTPMGGRRGYGPTHSQTLEKHFLGVPGLIVLAPAPFRHSQHPDSGPDELLYKAILLTQDPVLFVENKLLYLLTVLDETNLYDFDLQVTANQGMDAVPVVKAGEGRSPFQSLHPFAFLPPTFNLKLRAAPAPTLTMVAYGYMAELCRQAAVRLAYEQEIFTELVVPTCLSPIAMHPVLASARRSMRLLTVEEGGLSLGWGAEVVARAAEALGPRLACARRLAAHDLPVPASRPLEEVVLPGVEAIIQCVVEMHRVSGNN